MRVGDSIWYCLRINKDEPKDEPIYGKPIEVKTKFGYCTVIDKSGTSDIMQFGEKTSSYATMILQPYKKWKDIFDVNDLLYINGAEPSEDEEWYGERANYRVDNVGYGNLRMNVTLKRTTE